ncbi:FkbM family methyltransferase [Pseudoduganella umbonata]|uniref:FkbM family methyltransferase n=1 Tax=Pseudoduganella umbonata TaxID=864828 RepID=A0A4P8HSP0_9BURK|nr:FkbM family methyltransferase [Pseudoduganella umbonata]MBB3220857.1 hypothetical protein [Pseudoduganella umbonata]QCP11682.1 FkbM family methyltransferase [Pseudoduganella umbonata]
MTFTSYAGNLEDVLLRRVLHHVDSGFYIDVGAGDPLTGSVTRALYERGWRGINVEPGQAHQAALRRARPADINLQVAAAATAGDVLFYEAEGGPSGLDAARAAQLAAQGLRVRMRQTPAATLAQLCEQHASGPVHLLRISAGGTEDEVAAAMDWARWRPLVVVLRHHGRAPAAVLAGARYALAFDDGVNHYFVAEEHIGLAPLLATPANAGDGFVLCEDHPLSHPLAAMRATVADARQQAAEAAARLQETMAWVDARRREHDDALANAQRLAAQAARDAEELAAKNAQLRALDEQLRANAEWGMQVNAILHATQASLSWRVTRPLRDGNRLARGAVRRARRIAGKVRRRGTALAGNAAGSAVRVVRGSVVRVLKAGLAFVVARPKLSFYLRSAIARYPRLMVLARTVALRTKDKAGTPAAVAMADTSAMPAPARQALDHLRRSVRGQRNL